MTDKITRQFSVRVVTLVFTMFLSLVCVAADEDTIVVVVSSKSHVDQLSKREVIDIFMGRYQSFPDGTSVDTYDYRDGVILRQRFYQSLVGQSEQKIKSYWTKLLFTGRAVPPVVISSIEEMLVVIGSSVNALGYLPKSALNDSVKVVFELETGLGLE